MTPAEQAAPATADRSAPPARVLAGVAAGTALGAALRWQLGEAFPEDGAGFPATTFAVNLLGSVLLALLPASARVRRRPLLPPALGSGVLGGFTTLSAVSDQTRALAAAGDVAVAAAYSTGLLAACLLGVLLADLFSTAAQRREFEREEGDL